MFRCVIVGLTSLVSLAACAEAPTAEEVEGKLIAATAKAMPGIDPAAITISGHATAPSRTTWNASISGKTFHCDADELMRLPQCVPAV